MSKDTDDAALGMLNTLFLIIIIIVIIISLSLAPLLPGGEVFSDTH